MITVAQALSLIEKHVKSNNFCELGITDALGFVLAQDVVSDIDLPPFRQSAMDGFAVRTWAENEFTIKGEIQAGSSEEVSLQKGEAVRIYTGARVPRDADRVIMKEHVEDLTSHIQVVNFQQKTNIKAQGEHIKRGDVVLSKGVVLNTAALSFLAGLGVAKIKVYKKPNVAVLISGNELLQPGDPWEQAKTYDSNSFILQFLLKSIGVEQVTLHYVKDDVQACVSTVGKLLESHDFIVATGGISVGDYDLMHMAFEANHVEEQFYKINQKPGKPIYFGLKGDKVIFGLPGNPAACFINFQVYVTPALRRRFGKTSFSFKIGVCDQRIVNRSNKALFLRGTCTNGILEVFENQSSSLLQSLIGANVLVYIPEDVECIEIGDQVQYLDLVQ
jgi:molybdopterin molybdotransferase